MRRLRIESPDNARFKSWKLCLKASGIEKTGQFLLSGPKIVAEELTARPERYSAVLLPLEYGDFAQADIAEANRIQIVELPKAMLAQLNELGTPGPILVGKKPEWPVFDPLSEPSGLEVMLAMQDPSNVGAAIRSSLAFGASKIILLAECAHPLLPRALKASSGAAVRAPIELGPSFSLLAPEAQSLLTALDLTGVPVADLRWPKSVRLVVGEEGQGLPAAFKPRARVKIEISDAMESLNAGAALAIALYAYRASR